MKDKSLVVISGPTGIGKTGISIDIALKLDTSVVSADSRQIYKELKIGTAVPSQKQLEKIKHYMIGNKSIHEYYNASMFEFEVLDILTELFKTKNAVLLTGGSGMYINAVCRGIDDLPTVDPRLRQELKNRWQTEGIESLRFELKRLDPDYYNEADLKNPKRILKALEICLMTGIPYSSLRTNKNKTRNFKTIKIGLNRHRDELYDIINRRVDKMIEHGLIEEARQFNKIRELNSLNTVGYKELFGYFNNEYSLEKAIELIKRNSRRYAKRQLSWFNRDQEITWFHPDEKQKIMEYIDSRI